MIYDDHVLALPHILLYIVVLHFPVSFANIHITYPQYPLCVFAYLTNGT